MLLVLFDIDGTLVNVRHDVTRGVVRDVALRGLGDASVADGVELHGKTDRQIMLELCATAGLPEHTTADACTLMERVLMEHWGRCLDETTVDVLPGVQELLAHMATIPDVRLGLLTGNLEAAARLKLAPHALNRFFPYGAYGSDAVDRNLLPPVALRRATEHDGHPHSYERSVIIGDSHRDIACARAWGVRAVAVATGILDAEELRRHRPDALLADLADVGAVLAAVTGISHHDHIAG